MQRTDLKLSEHDAIATQTYEFLALGGKIVEIAPKTVKEIIADARECRKLETKRARHIDLRG